MQLKKCSIEGESDDSGSTFLKTQKLQIEKNLKKMQKDGIGSGNSCNSLQPFEPY